MNPPEHTILLLDMLQFDWVQDIGMGGIGFIEERLEIINITERIIQNLKDSLYCIKYSRDACRAGCLDESVSTLNNRFQTRM
jgi:hypothetical protein